MIWYFIIRGVTYKDTRHIRSYNFYY